mgnify:CR=1 FL=1
MREKPSQRIEEDEVLFLHQGNDERGKSGRGGGEKKEGYLSPNMRIRRQ